MDIVLGVSMTPTTVRMVLVEGDKADGATVEHDTFDIVSVEGQASSSATDHVISAILGTREGAVAGGHRLSSTGVAWSDRAEASQLREAVAARGINGVTLVPELQAAAALAQAAGGLVGYDKTAVLLVGRDTATLAVVDTTDGSIVKVDSRPVANVDAMAVVAHMVTSLSDHSSQPDGMFVVGSDHDLAAVKEHVGDLVSIPVSAPSDAEMALARGAALAAANLGDSEASTTALAYSQDPDLTTAATGAYTEADLVAALSSPGHQSGRKPFMLVGSTMAAVFMVGVVALVISLAVSIRPTVDSRPSPGVGVVPPNLAAPAAPTVENAKPPAPPAAVVPAPAAPPAPAPPPAALPPIAPPELAAQQAPPVVHAPVVQPKAAQVAAPAVAPPPPAAPPPAPVPAAPPPAPAPAAVPDYPQTDYPPGAGPAPQYGPGYGPPPRYGRGYGPAPGYGPGYAPASPQIPIIPGILGIGPRPAYREPGPGWYGRGHGPWLWPGG